MCAWLPPHVATEEVDHMTAHTLYPMPVTKPAGAANARRLLEAALVFVNAAMAVILVYGMLIWDDGTAIWLAPGALLRIIAAFGMWQGWRGRWSFQVACGLWLVLLGCLFLFTLQPHSFAAG
jgi:hypothetical protein